MTTVTESDLKRLEDLIINGQKAIDARFTAVESRFTAIENRLGEIKEDIKVLEAGQTEIHQDIQNLAIGQTEIKGEIRTLDARITGLEKRTDDLNGRLNIMTVGFLSIIGVFATAIVGILGKFVFFPLNP
jgi:chromosome segregation ATPase